MDKILLLILVCREE